MSYYQVLIDRGGGIINTGQGLGVIIGPKDTMVPVGWCFVPIEIATVELIEECCNAMRNRNEWPENETTGLKQQVSYPQGVKI